jgi:hypothetical protein
MIKKIGRKILSSGSGVMINCAKSGAILAGQALKKKVPPLIKHRIVSFRRENRHRSLNGATNSAPLRQVNHDSDLVIFVSRPSLGQAQ